MRKKKPKVKKIYHRLTFWAGVLVLGAAVGLAVQFTRAWVEPSASAPGGNIAAPINTGAVTQTKNGGDICVNFNGSTKCISSGGGGPTTGNCVCYISGGPCSGALLMNCGDGWKQGGNWSVWIGAPQYCFGGFNNVANAYFSCSPDYNNFLGGDLHGKWHSSSDCTGKGGVVVQDGSEKFCQFGGGSCPSGWTKYNNWSETSANTCNGAHVGSCNGRTSCTTSAHGWANAGTETCGYKNEATGQNWNPEFACTSSFPCGESYCPYAYCSSNDQSNCSSVCDEMGCRIECNPSCVLDSDPNDGYPYPPCGSYSDYCATANATCTANATKVGCY